MQWLLQKLPKLANIFRLHRQIGEGTFSAVFLASLLNDFEQNKLFAIKHLVPTTHPVRIEVELRCLQLIGCVMTKINNTAHSNPISLLLNILHY